MPVLVSYIHTVVHQTWSLSSSLYNVFLSVKCVYICTCISEEGHAVRVDYSVLRVVEPIPTVVPAERDVSFWPSVC